MKVYVLDYSIQYQYKFLPPLFLRMNLTIHEKANSSVNLSVVGKCEFPDSCLKKSDVF